MSGTWRATGKCAGCLRESKVALENLKELPHTLRT